MAEFTLALSLDQAFVNAEDLGGPYAAHNDLLMLLLDSVLPGARIARPDQFLGHELLGFHLEAALLYDVIVIHGLVLVEQHFTRPEILNLSPLPHFFELGLGQAPENIGDKSHAVLFECCVELSLHAAQLILLQSQEALFRGRNLYLRAQFEAYNWQVGLKGHVDNVGPFICVLKGLTRLERLRTCTNSDLVNNLGTHPSEALKLTKKVANLFELPLGASVGLQYLLDGFFFLFKIIVVTAINKIFKIGVPQLLRVVNSAEDGLGFLLFISGLLYLPFAFLNVAE